MDSRESERSVGRARWLGELADVLRQAEELASTLALWRPGSAEAVLVRSRIIATRASVDALQRRRELGVGPYWSERGRARTGKAPPRPDQTP